MKHSLTTSDILSPEEYAKIRNEKRRSIIATKRNRRLSVGPSATFYFENYDTMWLQVHEMLRIEKGGTEQLADELRAYNPMIPQGHELTATVMFEIDDPIRRTNLLSRLGGVENTMELRFADEVIKGRAEQDLDYTSDEGKASAVQFVHFELTKPQIEKFHKTSCNAMVAITHTHYGHIAIMPQSMKEELLKDFI